MKVDPWMTELEAERADKDAFFGGQSQSPIPPGDRLGFVGLDYFPPDPDFRFEIELREHAEKQAERMAYTKGELQEFTRWGEFRFEIGGEECVLQAYKADAREGQLFVPLRDATSGQETYAAGRYLDLRPDTDRTPEGKWVLDLNRAYNPWCAYSEAYTCPYVPPENWLSVPVRAGEKKYPRAE